ncbi:hypothetical protein CsSME_00039018 [Camellia sinensis var. sinensis]
MGGDLREPSVGAAEVRPVVTSPPPPPIGAARWDRAEEATQKIICQVQPTAVSEERRGKVIDYVQRLIRGCIGCEVFPFGSVPLKTYLPDGDIDLTAFGGASFEDALVNDVVAVLEAEDQNGAAEFVVKDVQLIRAEVKLVKCIVQNIVVDISFNQLGGLCTLCFLEQVDRLIGKDHLFKRSIILIKAWCYYESRILGAHHGLISTYALETLVLYIFHFFHSTLNGPLAVLYRFLDYFSKFDWDNYCISLTGPVRTSSLPEIVAEKPENGGSDLLLSNDFLRCCADKFSVPSRGVDINSRTFPQKHLNIIDPLKENNNLGRSVSKGNFFRIRSAFAYGARKLGRILLQPEDDIAGELTNFFSNTLDRHGSGQRPDVQDPVPMSGHNGFVLASLPSQTESCQEEKEISELKSANSVRINGLCKLDPDGSSDNGTVNGHQNGSMKVVNSTLFLEAHGSVNTHNRFSGDAEDLATSRIHGLKISNESPKASHRSGEESMSQRGFAYHAPHLYFSRNGKPGYGNSETKEVESSGLTAERVSSGLVPVPDEGTGIFVGHGRDENLSVGNHEHLTTIGSRDVGYREKTSIRAARSPEYEYVNSLSDLSGDYDSHLGSLLYGRQCCYEHSSVPVLSVPPPPLPSQFQSKSPWDVIRQHSYQFKRNGFSNVNANGVIPRPAFYPLNTMLIPGTTFGVDEVPKPRGTGTYFPNANRPPYQNPSTGRGRNQGPMRSPRNNGRAATPTEANLLDRRSRELSSQAQFSDQVNGTLGSSDYCDSGSPSGKVPPDVNGFGHVPSGVPSPERTGQLNSAYMLTQTSTQSLPTPGMQKSQPVPGMNQDRYENFVISENFHLLLLCW